MINERYSFGRSIFVCSKPLQFFHLVAISKYYSINKPKVYIITTGFSGWENFQENIISSEFNEIFSDIIFYESYIDVAKSIRQDKYNSLFIEDDRVSLYFIFNKLKKEKIIVFEEGFGTYYSDYPQRLTALKKIKWISVAFTKGCGINFGGGRSTDYVLVQYPLVYKKLNKMSSLKALYFSGVANIFSSHNNFWNNIVSKDLKVFYSYSPEVKVALVLGTWGGAQSKEIREIYDNYDFVIYKSHPNDIMVINVDKVYNLESVWIPAEVFVYRLANIFHNLDVYHYSSSTAFYLDGSMKNVEFIDLLKDSRFEKSLKIKRDLYNSISA